MSDVVAGYHKVVPKVVSGRDGGMWSTVTWELMQCQTRTGMMQPYLGRAGEGPTVLDKMLISLYHRSRYSASNAGGLSGGKETKPGTSAQQSGRNKSVSCMVLFSAQPVCGGSEARVACQYTDTTSHHTLIPASPTDLTKKPVETDLIHSSSPPNLWGQCSASSVSGGCDGQVKQCSSAQFLTCKCWYPQP